MKKYSRIKSSYHDHDKELKFTLQNIYVRLFHAPVAPPCEWKNQTSQAQHINQLDLHMGMKRYISLLPSTIGSISSMGNNMEKVVFDEF